jgi:hypothetical protein
MCEKKGNSSTLNNQTDQGLLLKIKSRVAEGRNHRRKFWLFAWSSTILFEKIIFEAITKHQHLWWLEIPFHVFADILWCMAGEKGTSFFKKIWVSEKYSQAISLTINGTTHALYEIWHHSIHHTHNHTHEHHSHTIRLLTLITIKIIREQLYHNREHKSI